MNQNLVGLLDNFRIFVIMAKFIGNNIISISELEIVQYFKIHSSISLFGKEFKGNNIYFLVVKEFSNKKECGYTILHTDITDLKKWTNNNKTLYDLAKETKALFYLHIINEKELIKRIKHQDIGPDNIWNVYETINKDDFKSYIRNIEIDNLLK
mgnify:CR=1 FL=1